MKKIEESRYVDYILRTLEYNSKKVLHVQYLGWPDHGVPNDIVSFAKFVTTCEDLIKSAPGTIVVHCR